MKNFKYLLIIVAAVMLFASCSDDGDEQKFTDYSGIYHGIVTSTQVYVNNSACAFIVSYNILLNDFFHFITIFINTHINIAIVVLRYD